MGCFDHQTYEFSGRVWILRVWCVFWRRKKNKPKRKARFKNHQWFPYISMRQVYFPTWIVDVYGKCRYIYIYHTWMLLECCRTRSKAWQLWFMEMGWCWLKCVPCMQIHTTLSILGMSRGVKNTFIEAPGVSLGGSGISIGGVKILRVCTYVCICWLVDRTGTSWIFWKKTE